MKTSKLSACLLLVSLVGSTIFTSCSKNTTPAATSVTLENISGETIVVDKDTEVIEETSEWYSTERVNIADAFYADGKAYSSCFIRYLGLIDTTYYCIVDYSEMSSSDNKKEIIAADDKGNLISRIELSQFIADDEYYSDIYIQDNTVKAIIQQYPATFFVVDVDVLEGTVSSRSEINVGKATGLGDFNELIVLDNYDIETYSSRSSTGNYCSTSMVITDANNNVQTISINDYYPDEKIDWISDIYEYGDNSILIIASGSRGWDYYFKLDFTDMSMEELCPGGTRWLGRISPSTVTALNGHFYAVDRGVVKEINYDTHETEDVFDFNYCNINRHDLNDCKLVDYNEDTIVLSCNTWASNNYTDNYHGFYLYKLTKEDTNPNAGKAVIEVGCIGEISRPIADAIYEFNTTNEFFYIHYDTRYDVYDSMDIKYDSSDEDKQKAYINAQCTLSNQMAIDLLNGEGPDIIIDGFGYGQLNNSNYMLDLTPYYETLDKDNFFDNVIEGSKTNGALYQIPLSFSIDGIVTSGANVEDGQTGFTFDEYCQFVDQIMNGKDPINLPRLQYFNMCIDAMSDLFADGNGFNYDNQDFRELANYINDNVFDNPYYTEILIDELVEPAYFWSIRGFVEYLEVFQELHYQDMTFLGIPSSDGRGPTISVINSIGISAQALNPDACWLVIETLLGEEVQDSIAVEWSFPVNRTSYETTALAMVDRYNNILNGNINYSYSGWALVGPEVEEQAVYSFADKCIGVSHVKVADPTISIIISEEIQPFFVGQKSIDEILVILQDRINTFVAERE